eukprot:2477032-Ditylum_brightwellii.AAC.1
MAANLCPGQMVFKKATQLDKPNKWGEESKSDDECNNVNETIFPGGYQYFLTVSAVNNAMEQYEKEPDAILVGEIVKKFLAAHCNILQ